MAAFSPFEDAFGEGSVTSSEVEVKDLVLEGDKSVATRMVLVSPKGLAKGTKVPLVVLLHGLGETGDQKLGAWAWVDRYGLVSCYERLRKDPIARTSKRGDFPDERVKAINQDLKTRAFGGLVIACPYTPNANKAANPTGTLDKYADWLETKVVPKARAEGPASTEPARTALGGCSMGGYIALEVFARKPAVFGALQLVQAAFGAHRAAHWAEKIETALKKSPAITGSAAARVHVLTSEGDTFKDANDALVKELKKRSVGVEQRVHPGPHDQPWLREVGTLETLLWHERRMAIKKP
jgi:enterochelin esterase-like enzyme